MASIAAKLGFAPAHSRSNSALAGVAGGVALALVGLVGRKLLVQAPTALAGNWDKALAAEHKITLKLFDKLAKAKRRPARTVLLTQLKHALGKHAMEEENAVYPAMRDAGMLKEADDLNRDHGYVKQFLYDLGELIDDRQAFVDKLALFRSDIEKHMRMEEEQLFPRLKRALTEERNHKLTGQMNKEGLKLA